MAKLSTFDRFELRLNTVQNTWLQRKDMYAEYYRQIRGVDRGDKPSKPWGAKVNSQLTHTQLNTLTDFTMAGLMPTSPFLHAECGEPYRLIGTETPGTEEFKKRLKRMYYYRNMRRWIRGAGSFGVGVVKLLGAGKPRMFQVDPGNMAWQPGCTDFRHDAKWVIERYTNLTIEEVEALQKAGVFNKKLKGLINWARTPNMDAVKQRYEERHGYQHETALYDPDSELVLFDMVTPDRIVTVHYDSRTVLRDIPNPYGYIPYYDLSAYIEIFDPHGFALPELLSDLQDEINTTRRQRIDIASLEASPMMAIARSSGQDPNRVLIRPGGVLFVNNPQTDVKWLQAQDSTAALSQVEAVLERDSDRVTGVQAQTRGERGEQMKATVASIINANVNVRFQVNTNDMLDYPLRDFYSDLVNLSMLDEGPIAVTQPEWARIQEAVEFDKFELVPHLESYVGQGAQKFQMMSNLFQLLATVTAPEGLGEFVKDMLNQIGLRDPERITQYIQGAPVPGQGGGAGQLAAPQTPGPALLQESARGRSPGQAGMSGRTAV